MCLKWKRKHASSKGRCCVCMCVLDHNMHFLSCLSSQSKEFESFQTIKTEKNIDGKGSSKLIHPVFFGHATACGILVPWREIKPVPPAVEAWIPNHWTPQEFLAHRFLNYRFSEKLTIIWTLYSNWFYPF